MIRRTTPLRPTRCPECRDLRRKCPACSKGSKARKPVKAVNRKRRDREFERAYHSVERVEFVKSLPCRACNGAGSENAHTKDSEAGMGRKGSYRSIVPLCGGLSGCHRALHRIGQASFERQTGLDLAAEAALTEKWWVAHKGE